MTSDDFAGTAAQIMIIAYGDPEAREQIAKILLMAWMQGKTDGLDAARKIYAEAFADFSTEGRTP